VQADRSYLRGFGVEWLGFRFRVEHAGFKIEGAGLRVEEASFKIKGLVGWRAGRPLVPDAVLEFRAQSIGFKSRGFGVGMWGVGCRFRV